MTRPICILLFSVLVGGIPATTFAADDGQVAAAGPASFLGIVVSATSSTLVLRMEDGSYKLFELDRDTTKPRQIPSGATASVLTTGRFNEEVPYVNAVRITAMPAAPAPGEPPPAAVPGEPVPPAVRRAERQIQREVSRWKAGVRTGAALGPEQIMLGGQAQLGPFFSDNVWGRPNLEWLFGEVTDQIAINLEGMYRLPVTNRDSRWTVYLGGGPGFNFIKRGFDTGRFSDEDVEFGDWGFDVGLNFFIGMQMRSGMFLELKAAAYAEPTLRFAVGYNFGFTP